MQQQPTKKTMRVFLLIWFGQLISLMGSGINAFALGIWMYQRTGSATQFALISLCSTLPTIAISPLAGILVDRWNRRPVMILSDAGAGLSTLAIALLFLDDRLDFWHICLLTAVSSAFGAFQYPAYTAAITQLVPQQHLSRASGLVQIAGSTTQLAAPALGGVLLTMVQLQGVMLLDFATFLVSLFTLLLVQFPDIKFSAAKIQEESSLFGEAASGWLYILARPGLLGLLIFFAIRNFLLSIFWILMDPFVLSFSSPAVLGTTLSISATGMLVSTLVISTWGEPKRLIYSLLSFVLLGGLSILVAGVRSSISLFTLSTFLLSLSLPIVQTCSQVIWQKKIPTHIQGRVFAAKGMISGATVPLACLVAGPLADCFFEPFMNPKGLFANSFGQLIGTGTGRGIGLLFVFLGGLTMLATITAYCYPPLRHVEYELPDVVSSEGLCCKDL